MKACGENVASVVKDNANRFLMEIQALKLQEKPYVHYNHTLPSQFPRWTPKECYQFMSARPWQRVREFYLEIVNGRLPLSSLFQTEKPLFRNESLYCDDYTSDTSDETRPGNMSMEEKHGRWARVTFKIIISYHGASFDGWQKQPGLNTVQNLVEKSLGTFVDERKAQALKDQSKPLEGCAVVAGRTDKGVSALQQVCSFYTWRKDVNIVAVEDAINDAAPGKLRVVSVSKVSRVFHPNFSAKWRRYLYIFPFNDEEYVQRSQDEKSVANSLNHGSVPDKDVEEADVDKVIIEEETKLGISKELTKFSVSKVDQLLEHLEGKLLSYKIFARDTKASRSIGPPTECFIYHARAAEARLPSSVHGGGTKVMCVELIANRFLRKMVRVLVATSIREAAAGAEEDTLLRLMDATCRRATAPPAPPDGLCLVDVGYTEFNPSISLIQHRRRGGI